MSADRVAQLRADREAFAYAMAHRITVAEARHRIAEARWKVIADRAVARVVASAAHIPSVAQESGRPLQWWQRD